MSLRKKISRLFGERVQLLGPGTLEEKMRRCNSPGYRIRLFCESLVDSLLDRLGFGG
jgi:hypothetical protein